MSRYYDVTLLTADLEHVVVRAQGNTQTSAERSARSKARRNGVVLCGCSAVKFEHVKDVR